MNGTHTVHVQGVNIFSLIAYGVIQSLWEHFDAYPIFVHPTVADISDMEVDIVRPKLAINR